MQKIVTLILPLATLSFFLFLLLYSETRNPTLIPHKIASASENPTVTPTIITPTQGMTPEIVKDVLVKHPAITVNTDEAFVSIKQQGSKYRIQFRKNKSSNSRFTNVDVLLSEEQLDTLFSELSSKK